MEPLRIVIVDDHPIVRQGLRAVIRTLPEMEVVGEARDGKEALAGNGEDAVASLDAKLLDKDLAAGAFGHERALALS